MKIHDFAPGPNPARIRIALAEKGLASQVSFVPVDLPGAEHKQPAFLAINPAGTVPVLELDDGTYISECTAITEYLDHLDDNPVLTGRTPRQRGVIHMMQKRAEAELLEPVGLYFHHATPGLGPVLERYKQPDWPGRGGWGRAQGDRALAGMAYFDGVLQTQPYVAGQQFSMADITVWAGLMFADFAQLPIPTACRALAAWRVHMAERPSVKHPA